jgi:hypothetical protein
MAESDTGIGGETEASGSDPDENSSAADDRGDGRTEAQATGDDPKSSQEVTDRDRAAVKDQVNGMPATGTGATTPDALAPAVLMWLAGLLALACSLYAARHQRRQPGAPE